MGNDIGIAENAKLGGGNAAENGDLSLVGGSKQFDEDKIFKQAVDEESLTIGSENSTTTEGQSMAVASPVNSNEGSSDVSNDAHEFEGVTEAPGAGLNVEIDVAKTGLLMSEEIHEEKQTSTEVRVEIETDRYLDDVTDENSKGDGRAIVDSDATANKTENLSNGQKMLEKSDKKPGDGILSNTSDLEALTSGGAGIDASDGQEAQNLQMQEILKPNVSIGTETAPYKLEIERHEINEVQDVSNVKGADTKLEIQGLEVTEIQDVNDAKGTDTLANTPDGSLNWASLVGFLNHEDGKSAEHDRLREHIHKVPLDVADVINGTGANLRTVSESNEDALHKNEQHAVLDSGHQRDRDENTSSNLLHSEQEEDHTVELLEVPCISGDILKDDNNTKLKEIDSECVQIEKADSKDAEKEGCDRFPSADNMLHSEIKEVQIGEQEESCISCDILEVDAILELKKVDTECVEIEKVDSKDADKEECGGISSADASSAADHNKVRSETNLNPVLDGRTWNLETEGKPCSSPSEILAENSRSSQLRIVNSNVEFSKTVAKWQEQEVVKTDHMEIHMPESKKLVVHPVSGISSSVGKSFELAPAHPSSLDHAGKTVGSVSEDASANPEQDIKPIADISSVNLVSPHPVGLRHTVQLPEPDSRNKEEVSKSAAGILSNSNTSAASAHPAGLGRAPLLESTSRVVQVPRVNGAVSPAQNQLVEDPTNGDTEGYDETREKLQIIRVKFLRLAHRLGQTPHNVVVAQVLYRLGLAEQLHGRSGGRVAAFSFDRASALAEQLEAAGQEPLDFTCTIMVLGKSGVGKSATINSIFDEVMFDTDAFQSGTKKVQDVVGTVQGIRVRVIDTPGLLPSWSDQCQNEKILRSVKKFIKKTPPDIVLYLDRLDMQSIDFGDLPLLRTVTGIFGPSIWFNAIVVLTHAASAPPEGPNGTATSYEMFVTQRSQAVQQAIRQAAGDMRLMNPVSLVENHSACRTNRAGQRVLPNGQIWKPHLLLLSFASKILAEANTLLKLQDIPSGRPHSSQIRSPPLPFLLSSLLQSRPEVKLPSEQFGDDDDAINDDLDECSDSIEESEYDELPPFKSLTTAQLEKLSKEQRKAYYDELDYRETLLMKKQLREERKRQKMMMKLQDEAKASSPDYGNNVEEETSGSASVPVPMPDVVLPSSFDSDNPTHRYRSLDSSNPWLVRALLEPNGWDHDIGYDGINFERLFVIKDRVPVSFSGHISKDKKDTSLQMEIASSVKHGNGKATTLGFDMQSVGKDYAYTLRSETRFSNRRINKASAGLSATVLGDVLTGGIKVEDKLIIGKRGQLVVSGGAICGHGEVAYGGSLEATLRDRDHPFGRSLSTLGLSVMDWNGDLALGCNVQTQIPIGRHQNMIGRLNINNKGSGQLSVRINSSEQLQIVLVGLIPLVKKLLSYSEQVQDGW